MSRHGLANLGNSCYLNSAFQALAHTKFFRDFMGGDAWETYHDTEKKGARLAETTAALIRQMQSSGTQPIMPVPFYRAFIEFARTVNDDITPGAQADAAEAVQILLDGLHVQASRPVKMNITGRPVSSAAKELKTSMHSWATHFEKEYSPLVDNLYGQTQTRVECNKCGTASIRYEPWNVLKVPIPGAEKEGSPIPTLYECIAAALADDTLDDYACEGCKCRGPAQMKHAISRFPAHLILSLKRFTNSGRKVKARIPYDENNVDLSPWRAWPTLQKTDDVQYRVTSVIDHFGAMGGGHYCMRAREPEGWFVFDDWRVAPSPIGGSACPDTYILFMELREKDEQ